MTSADSTSAIMTHDKVEYATFYVGELLLGVDINQIQEINRQLNLTRVSHAPNYVRGVINLRGDVVTVVDLRAILQLPIVDISHENRNVIIKSGDEHIGLLIDRIADVVVYKQDEIEPSPANVGSVDGAFFKGVCKLESELLILLDTEKVFDMDASAAASSSVGMD